ncbi:unnamed protein product [Alternaria sp. RS040]
MPVFPNKVTFFAEGVESCFELDEQHDCPICMEHLDETSPELNLSANVWFKRLSWPLFLVRIVGIWVRWCIRTSPSMMRMSRFGLSLKKFVGRFDLTLNTYVGFTQISFCRTLKI